MEILSLFSTFLLFYVNEIKQFHLHEKKIIFGSDYLLLAKLILHTSGCHTVIFLLLNSFWQMVKDLTKNSEEIQGFYIDQDNFVFFP